MIVSYLSYPFLRFLLFLSLCLFLFFFFTALTQFNRNCTKVVFPPSTHLGNQEKPNRPCIFIFSVLDWN